MMEQSLRRVFKYLALVARGIGLFPFFIIFSYIYSKQYDEALFGAQLVGLIIAVVVGYMQVRIHAYLEEKLQEKLWLERMIIGILYSLEIGMMVYIVWNYYVTDMIMRLFTCVVYLILYSMSVKAYEQHYTRVLAIEMIVFISFCYVIAMVLGKYSVIFFI